MSDWTRHVKTNKHIRNINNFKNLLECKLCDYTCSKQSVLEKHFATTKHKKRASNSSHDITSGDSTNDVDLRKISSQNGTFPKCSEITPNDYMAVVGQLLTQNNELKNFILEQANEHKKETAEIMNKVIEMSKTMCTINGNVNTNNKFNINVYLNEQCKDAMNLSDFIKNIEVSHEDLENNAQLGFVNGISKIIVDNLKHMAANERPIHCTDLKRETMYIKEDNKWNKEENDAKLRSIIQAVTSKSIGTLINWKQENPDYEDMDSEFSNRCIVIQQQSMAGYNRDTYYPKVIHAIARETLINK
jgi:hypothetical protein